MIRTCLSIALASVVLPLAASAYPGGTPSFQTDVLPYCASCHSSLDEAALAGAGQRATKEIVANKHLAVIDDVVTTTATANTMAAILARNGAARIDIWCLARTP